MDFQAEVAKLGIELTSEQISKFAKYYELLIRTNQEYNLTRITEKEDVYRKHFLDSLELCRVLDFKKNTIQLCDVGAGAGFPSVPLAIVFPDVKVTILEALAKRVKFLNELVLALDLNNVKALHFRAEDYAKTNFETFDVVTARAVANLNKLTQFCMPLVKVGGLFVAMKGSNWALEVAEASNIYKYGGKISTTLEFELPDEQEKRAIVVIKKQKSCKRGL